MTSHYQSLTAWCERNSNLISIKIKFPWMSVDPYEAGPFTLSSLSDLQIINITGLFFKINLLNLPSLKFLKIKHRQSKIKLKAFPKAVLCLLMLSATVNAEDFISITNFELQYDSVKSFDLINGQIGILQKIPHLFALRTNNFDLVPLYYQHQNLRYLYLIFPKFVTVQLEDLFPKLGEIRFLSTLIIDFKFCNQSSPGQVKFNLPQVTTLILKQAKLVDDPVQITEDATSLEHFQISFTDIKKLYIKAPHIQYVKLKFLKKYDDLVITARTGYTLSLEASPVHIKRCPGIGKLIVNANFGGHFTAEEMQPDFYEHLQIIQMKDLNKYSNQWFHSFARTAPKLSFILLQFYKFVGLANEQTDKILHILNPTIKWVTLLCGQCIFQSLIVDKKCINLKLLKFRDFELTSFENHSTARIASEKNLVSGKDF